MDKNGSAILIGANCRYVLQAAGGGGASWAEHGERGARAGVPAAPLRAVLHPGHGLGPLLRRLRQVLAKVY